MSVLKENVLTWWSEKGKILSFRIMILILFVSVAARQYPPFTNYLPEEKFLLLFVGPLLLLMLDILMEGKSTDNNHSIYHRLVNPDQALDEFKKKISSAQTLDVAGSSTESMYLSFRDQLLSSKIRCRLIFRCPVEGDKAQHDKIVRYTELWTSITEENPNFQIEIKYSHNTMLRLVIFDSKDVYMGFYKWDGKRFWGHNVPLINATPGENLDNYIIEICNNRFACLWDNSTTEITYRKNKS